MKTGKYIHKAYTNYYDVLVTYCIGKPVVSELTTTLKRKVTCPKCLLKTARNDAIKKDLKEQKVKEQKVVIRQSLDRFRVIRDDKTGKRLFDNDIKRILEKEIDNFSKQKYTFVQIYDIVYKYCLGLDLDRNKLFNTYTKRIYNIKERLK